MTTCYDPGTLRAYLDEELPAADRAAVAAHLGDCAACQTQLDELSALDARVRADFRATADATPDLDAALARVRAQLADVPTSAGTGLRRTTQHARRRPLIAGLAAAAALLIVLLVPSARAAADALLQIFRVQQVVYVSVSASRVQQLRNLRLDQSALFLTPPSEVGTPVAPQTVASLQAAQPLLGFTPLVPNQFTSAPTSTTYAVDGQTTYQTQVNVTTLRQVLATLGVTDVQIPDALGAQPITATMPPNVRLQYQGAGYTLNLIEGTSPTVTLPHGVDLQQLGKAVLEVYGMSPQQADTMSGQIDWGSTLVFPFPLGTNRIQQVNVHGSQGVFLDASQNNNRALLLYWQQGSHFYILQGRGDALGQAAMLEIADSLR